MILFDRLPCIWAAQNIQFGSIHIPTATFSVEGSFLKHLSLLSEAENGQGGSPPILRNKKETVRPRSSPSPLTPALQSSLLLPPRPKPKLSPLQRGTEAVAAAATPVATLRSQCSDVPPFPPSPRKARATRCTRPIQPPLALNGRKWEIFVPRRKSSPH